MKMQFVLFAVLSVLSLNSHSACVCKCVNGEVVPLCSSTMDMPPLCSAAICPIVQPSIRPIQPIGIPPLGTSSCSMQQVYNKYTGQYQWQNICR